VTDDEFLSQSYLSKRGEQDNIVYPGYTLRIPLF
jgi:hypothetical protein